MLVAFTDGVTEASDAGARLFSEERAAEAVRAGGVISAAAVVDRLVSAVEPFAGQAAQADDITILALQFRPAVSRCRAPRESAGRDRGDSQSPGRSGAIEALLDRLATRAGLPSDTMSQIRIVCDEVLANVIAHGFPDEAEHEIEVSVEMAGRRLVLTVSDDGVPFDPLAAAPPDTRQPLEQRPIGVWASTWYAISSTRRPTSAAAIGTS